MLVDLQPFSADLTGKEAQVALDRAGITLNKNTVPGDPRSRSSHQACGSERRR
jgi:glycine hydroxymethyltransferase